MASEKEESKLPPFGAIVSIVLAASAYFLIQEPLKSSRPTGLKGNIATTDHELVDARLWQDPFAAVAEYKRKLKDPSEEEERDVVRHSQRHNRLKIEVSIKESPLPYEHQVSQVFLKRNVPEAVIQGKPVTILLVLTDPSPYAEGTETRIRDRYAVVSALQSRCYEPLDAEHLRFYTRTGTHDGTIPHDIPYEWYHNDPLRICATKQNDKMPEAVLVVWLMDDPDRNMGVKFVHDIASELYQNNPKTKNNLCQTKLDKACPAFKIIGPRNTSSWIEWLKRKNSPKNLEWNGKGGGTIEVFSPWATTDPLLISYAVGRRNGISPRAPMGAYIRHTKDRLGELGLDIQYEIPNDTAILGAIVDELELRTIDPAHDKVVLIGEWDTLYGKALSDEFRAVVASKKKILCGEHLGLPQETALWRVINMNIADCQQNNIVEYSYLRGLDGYVAQDRNESNHGRSKETPKKETDQSASRSIEFLDRPENTSQFDYIRRLAKRIKAENQPPEPVFPGLPKPGVSAIGILGSDVYDVLLILQALRPEFPDAVFFVTDLDARMLHPNETKWARNTITSSAFDLQLSENLQRGIPPFRSSYQTSAYYAALRAVGESDASYKPSPVLFEVGRQGAVPLRTPEENLVKVPKKEIGIAALCLVFIAFVSAHRQVIRSWKELWQPWMALALFVPTLLGGASIMIPLLWLGTVFFVVSLVWLIITRSLWELTLWELAIFSVLLMYGLAMMALAVYGPTLLGERSIMIPLLILLGIVFFVVSLIISSIVKRSMWELTIFLVLLMQGLAMMVLAWPEGIPDKVTVEPLSFLNGISIWPSLALMLLTFWLSVFLFYKARSQICESIKRVNDAFLAKPQNALEKTESQPPRSQNDENVCKSWERYCVRILSWRSIAAIFWLVLGVVSLFYIVRTLYINLTEYQHVPLPPCRGRTCEMVFGILPLTLLAFYFLIFYIFNAVRVCGWWVLRVRDGMVLSEKPSEFKKILHVIGEHTKDLDSLFIYPLITFSLFLLSQSNLFDNWHLPTPIISWFIVMALLIIASGLLLKNAVENAREKAIMLLEQSLYTGERGTKQSEEIRKTIEDIRAMRVGAFESLLQHPVVSYGSIAVVAVIQHFFFQ